MRKVSDTMPALRRKIYSLKQKNADLKAKMAQLMQDIESAYLHTEAYAKTQTELEKARSLA